MSQIPPFIQQAEAFLAQKNYQKVIEIASSVLEPILSTEEEQRLITQSDNDWLFALQLRCVAYLGNEDYVNALSDAERMIRLMPQVFLGYYHRGVALFYLDQPDKAKKDFNHLLTMTLTPTAKYGVYFYFACIAYVAGNYENAIQYYSQALQLVQSDEDKGQVYCNLAIIYFCQNDMDAARNAYKTAYQLSPHNAHILSGITVLNAAAGHWEDAIKTWRDLIAWLPHFNDPDEVAKRYYRWTPPMADIARQIIARIDTSPIV